MYHTFKIYEFDMNPFLHDGWDLEIIEYVKKNANDIKIVPTDSITSRESEDVKSISTLIVDGNQIRENFPWLFDLYQTKILEYAIEFFNQEVFIASTDLYALNFNVQKGTKMRYECHIDSNPIQGVLYVTEHKKGGELIVSENSKAIGTQEIDENCKVISPKKGFLYLFSGEFFPHYVRTLIDDELRVSIPMNFYTKDNPESNRPKDLNYHLFKKEDKYV